MSLEAATLLADALVLFLAKSRSGRAVMVETPTRQLSVSHRNGFYVQTQRVPEDTALALFKQVLLSGYQLFVHDWTPLDLRGGGWLSLAEFQQQLCAMSRRHKQWNHIDIPARCLQCD
jgi:hypothetical protein